MSSPPLPGAERPGNTRKLSEPEDKENEDIHVEQRRSGSPDPEQQEGEEEPNTYEHIETRPLRHNYIIKRPRALQYSYKSRVISHGHGPTEELSRGPSQIHHSISTDSRNSSKPVKRFSEDVTKHRERLDLFIDLIWVGIISNLSSVFEYYYYESNEAGVALLLFLLVFLPSWRIWNFLREFLSSFYADDIFQRFFVFWILVLSVFYGNNLAYFAEDTERVKTILITLYLCIRASFVFMELGYSIWIPWLRRLMFFNYLILLPSGALWISAIFVSGPKAAAPAAVAIGWEYLAPLVLESPLRERLTPSEYRKEHDTHHLTTRMGSFFIITIGEGVLLLIKDGPLGIGITGTAGSSVWSLAIYLLLAFVYFNKDQSESYIPAVKKGGWKSWLWIFFHVPLFASLLTLSAGLMFLIREKPSESYNKKSFEVPEDKVHEFVQRTFWLVSTSLSIIMISVTAQALLDKSMDPPGTLLINNRYFRMAGRGVYIIIIMCVPLAKELDKVFYLGICGLLLSFVMSFEWVVSMESGGGIVEPKGLTVMMKRELRSRRASDT